MNLSEKTELDVVNRAITNRCKIVSETRWTTYGRCANTKDLCFQLYLMH